MGAARFGVAHNRTSESYFKIRFASNSGVCMVAGAGEKSQEAN